MANIPNATAVLPKAVAVLEQGSIFTWLTSEPLLKVKLLAYLL